MAIIKAAQHANQEKTLVFVLYIDETSKFVTPDDGSVESHHLAAWLRAGNSIGEFVPVISGGVIPAGAVMWFCSPRPPEGYLLCDGSEVSRVQYSQLFRAIGTIYGDGDSVSTFNLPNLVGRFVRGWGPVSPLDPTRNFGSLQGDGVGDHTHGLQPITHTHIITDPGHLHGVTDPGHKHEIIDFGHNHTVTDPGHQHDIDALSHTGWSDLFSRSNNGLLRIGINSSSIFYRNVKFVLSSMDANMVVATDPANLLLANAQSNVVAGDAFTGVSIDVATTNIPYTEITGNSETRPENMALLPVIRY
jgi:microcystin-dependent protein